MRRASIVLLLWGLVTATTAFGAERPILFGDDVPASAAIVLPGRVPPAIAPFTAYRAVVEIWGCPTAFLHYNGRWAADQSMHWVGSRAVPLCIVQKDDAAEAMTFATYVLPVIASPPEAANVTLKPTQLIAPNAPALKPLMRNLLRAYFEPLVQGRDLRSRQLRLELAREWIVQVQYNGLLHETQHAFAGYGRPAEKLPAWELEERSHLTALRHSPSPQIALSQILGQYAAGEGVYYEAVRDILANLVRRIAEQPAKYPRFDAGRNLMAQLHMLSRDELARLAGQVMRARWETWDTGRGLVMEYDRPRRIDVSGRFRLQYPEPELAAAPAVARHVRISAVSGHPEATGSVLVPNINQPPLQKTWGKSHWRLDGDTALAVVFTVPAELSKAKLRVTHMATTDDHGQGGKTFIRIHVNGKTLVEGHAPPQEKDNRLERPEEFDIRDLLQPGEPNWIAFAWDSRQRSTLVYWLESFEIVIE
jgi:hypothetical protein